MLGSAVLSVEQSVLGSAVLSVEQSVLGSAVLELSTRSSYPRVSVGVEKELQLAFCLLALSVNSVSSPLEKNTLTIIPDLKEPSAWLVPSPYFTYNIARTF